VQSKGSRWCDNDMMRMHMVSQYRKIIEAFGLVVEPVRCEIVVIGIGASDVSPLERRKDVFCTSYIHGTAKI
jgi:hypothetical protein